MKPRAFSYQVVRTQLYPGGENDTGAVSCWSIEHRLCPARHDKPKALSLSCVPGVYTYVVCSAQFCTTIAVHTTIRHFMRYIDWYGMTMSQSCPI
jgi:hypothetical protein